MGKLAEKMAMDLRVRGRSERTVKAYLRCARNFAAFHRRPPEELGEAELRAFVQHLMVVKQLGPDGLRGYLAALKFLYHHTLARPTEVAWMKMPRKPRRLPSILSRAEIEALVAAAHSPRMRAMILVGYGSGLRISEVCHLKVGDIDSKRGCIHVHAGKGNKDRLVPLPARLLGELRQYWKDARPPGPWLFPGALPAQPISMATVLTHLRWTVAQSGLSRRVRFHSLRHAFATHLLERGVDVVTLQAMMGHKKLTTTAGYLHVRTDHLLAVGSRLDPVPAT